MAQILIEAYDTLSNVVMAPKHLEKSTELKPTVQQLLDTKTFNTVMVWQGGKVTQQYLLNRKKDKWKKTI